MSKREKLGSMFSRPGLRIFAPLANLLITWVKTGTIVKTSYDKITKQYVHKENGRITIVDVRPYWNTTYSSLCNDVKNICCKNYYPRKGDIVIDLGAGVGTETIVFSECVGDMGKVYSIEAHPRTAASLLLLTNLNNYGNISVHQVAIGGQKDNVYIENKEFHVANSIVGIKNNDAIKIKMLSFDDFVKEQKIERIDFLKVNIEGAEERMLDGMVNSIGMINHIAVSCHDFLENEPSDRIKNKVIAFLKEKGFVVFPSDDQNLIRQSWIYAQKEVMCCN